MSRSDQLWLAQLTALREQGLLRTLHEVAPRHGMAIQRDGLSVVDFSSNDYLGLAASGRLIPAQLEATQQFGTGARASRLIGGTHPPHLALEAELARLKSTEAALSFANGYAAAVGTIPAIVGKGDCVILDKLAHASLIDGARLSGATLRIFAHNDLGQLADRLTWARRLHPAARILIITESVFSMDGDRCPLAELIEMKEKYNAMLLLDEAHATGVLGPAGAGLAAETHLAHCIEIQMGTLGKAAGVSGGFICGSRALIDLLVNRARSLVFSTAPSPATAATALEALRVLASREGDQLREKLWMNIRSVSSALRLAPAVSAIIPIPMETAEASVACSERLLAAGFYIPAIRYPTVARNAARLRLTVSALHEQAQLHAMVSALRQVENP